MIGTIEGPALGRRIVPRSHTVRRWMLISIDVLARGGGEMAATADDLVEVDGTFARETATGGRDAWIEAFAPCGMMLPNARSVVGQAALRSAMHPSFANGGFALTWEPMEGDTSSPGAPGYPWGQWERRTEDDSGRKRTSKHTHVTVWRRDPASEWKVVPDIGNEGE